MSSEKKQLIIYIILIAVGAVMFKNEVIFGALVNTAGWVGLIILAITHFTRSRKQKKYRL